MAKELLFHGGELDKEHFDGHTFWTRNLLQAAEYGSPLYVIEIDLAKEEVGDDEDYLPEGGYWECESNDENWEMQTQAIRDAVDDGSTVVLCSDGICIVNVDRLNPREVTYEEAEEMLENEE